MLGESLATVLKVRTYLDDDFVKPGNLDLELLVLVLLPVNHVDHLQDLDLLLLQVVDDLLLGVTLCLVYHGVHTDLLLYLLELVVQGYLHDLQLL